MSTKKRSIISVLLISVMIFSAASFASCKNETESAESITVSIFISGSSTNTANSEDYLSVLVEALPSEMTVLTATRHFCEVMDIDFSYDATLNSVKQIGSDIFDDKALAEDLREEEGLEGEDGAAEEATEAAGAADLSYFDWQSYVNGVESEINDKIKEGDKIEWKWKSFIPEDI